MKLFRFFRDYKQLGVIILLSILGLALDLSNQDKLAHLVLASTSLAMVAPMLIDMFHTLKEGRYGVDILAATAIVTSVLLGEYWAGMIIVLMMTGGEALEDYAQNRAKAELSSLLNKAPQTATVIKNGKQIIVPVSEVRVGDTLLIKPGDLVPVDAKIIEGASSFDESSLTGESLPVSKQLGDEVLSGSINNEGAVSVRAIHTSHDSQYEKIIALVKSAADSQAPFVRLTDKYSIPFTIVSFILAGAMWIATKDPNRFLQILVVATPCPLLIAAPIALISGMSRAARHGIIIKNGSILEKMASVKAIGFDKTGTLTRGKPVVSDIKTFNDFSVTEVLAFASGLEHQSTHILAQAIINKSKSDKSVKNIKLTDLKEIPGYGISAKHKKDNLQIGNLLYMKQLGIAMPKSLKSNSIQRTASYVACNKQLAGIIEFEDKARPESKSTIQKLRELGIKETILVTGDKQEVAKHIAEEVGIDTYFSNCLPGDKITAIKDLRKRFSPVAFVGDGVNDAPVLTSADVGIALGAKGSTAASEAADIVIMLDDISKVEQAREIATNTFAIARQSILIGIGMSFVLMGFFATGKFKPSLGAGLQEVVDVTVIINALRAHYGKFRKLQ